ncbi:hypothetical protein Dimus_032294, partial [Dionaea muscipula]
EHIAHDHAADHDAAHFAHDHDQDVDLAADDAKHFVDLAKDHNDNEVVDACSRTPHSPFYDTVEVKKLGEGMREVRPVRSVKLSQMLDHIRDYVVGLCPESGTPW